MTIIKVSHINTQKGPEEIEELFINGSQIRYFAHNPEGQGSILHLAGEDAPYLVTETCDELTKQFNA